MSLCRARGTRILYPRLPSAEALGFLISSRRAGLAAHRPLWICHTSCRASESKNPSHRAPWARHKKAHRFNGGEGINMNPESPGDDTCRITEILNGRRAITGDTALRLAHFFGTSPEFWLNLQSLYELRIAQKRAGKTINALPTLMPANGRAVSLLALVDTGDDMRPEYDFSGGVRGKHHLKYRSGKVIFPRSG